MAFDARVVADSVSPDGIRLTTLQITYPHAVHKDLLRHRVHSRSVMSFRAVPTKKFDQQLQDDPFIPEVFTKYVPGMSGGEPLSEEDQKKARRAWLSARDESVRAAKYLSEDLKVAKEYANILIQDFCWITEIVTATEWDNFFALRLEKKDDGTPMARPEVYRIASMMKQARDESDPFPMNYGEWHLPLITTEDYKRYEDTDHPDWEAADLAGFYLGDWDILKKLSASRCARVSFDKHADTEPHENTLARADMLLKNGHLSPFEHQATPLTYDDLRNALTSGQKGITTEFSDDLRGWSVGENGIDLSQTWSGNFRGWKQHRKEIPNESNYARI